MLAHLDISKGDQEEAALGTFFSSINYSNSHNQLYEDSFIQKIWSNTLVIRAGILYDNWRCNRNCIILKNKKQSTIQL